MDSKYAKELRVFQTHTLHRHSNFTGSTTDSFALGNGSRLVFTLQITAIDPATTVNIRIKNGFTKELPFEEILTITASSVGIFKKVLTDTHNLFDVVAEVTGGSATFYVAVSIADNALSTRVDISNAEIDVDLDHTIKPNGHYDSVRIGDGQEELQINEDGSLNATIVPPTGQLSKNLYNEVSSVPNNSTTNIVTYTVPPSKTAHLVRCEFSGDNIAVYELYIGANKQASRRTYFGNSLDGEINFKTALTEGLELSTGQTLVLKVTHFRPYVGTFAGRFQIIER